MSFADLLPQTLTVVRYTTDGENEYGNADLVEDTQVTIRGRLTQGGQNSGGSRENDTTGAYVVDRWLAYLPADTDIRAGDELLESGRRFRVEGTPRVVYGATEPHHIEAVLSYTAAVEA